MDWRVPRLTTFVHLHTSHEYHLASEYGLFRVMTVRRRVRRDGPARRHRTCGVGRQGVGPAQYDKYGLRVRNVARPELIIQVTNGTECEARAAAAAEKPPQRASALTAHRSSARARGCHSSSATSRATPGVCRCRRRGAAMRRHPLTGLWGSGRRSPPWVAPHMVQRSAMHSRPPPLRHSALRSRAWTG
jgi:hypothetical protein